MADRVDMSMQAYVDESGDDQLVYFKDSSAIHADENSGDTFVNFSDSDLDEISSFPSFLEGITSGIYLRKFLRNFKAGMQYVLHRGNIANNLTTTTEGSVLDATQGKILKDQIDSKINTSDIVDGLTQETSGKVLDARQGYLLNTNKVNISDIKNNLNTETAGSPLDAVQGKILKEQVDSKISTSNIADDLNQSTPGKVLDARQGYVLNTNKVNTSDIINNLNQPTSGKVLDAYQGNLLNVNKIETSAITNNLTTADTDTGKVLDARQGKVLNDRITTEVSNINTGLNAKVNVSDVANNLTTSISGKVLDARQGKILFDSISKNLGPIINDLTQPSPVQILKTNYFIYYDESYGQRLCRVLENINIGDNFVLDTNYEIVTEYLNSVADTTAFSMVVIGGTGYFYRSNQEIDPNVFGNVALLNYNVISNTATDETEGE